MSGFCSVSLFLIILFQAGNVPSFPEGIFTEKEKKKIEKNMDDLDERIEAYKDASERMQKLLRKTFSNKEYSRVPQQVEDWISLLSGSLEDIRANINPKKKKSKDLIKYEIQIRRAIDDLRDYKIRAPYEQQDSFERWIERADTIRGKFVDILFQPEKAVEQEANR